MSSTIRPSSTLEHLQRPRLVAVAGLARLVLPERGRAVRGHGRDHARAPAADPRPEPPLEDVVTAAAATGRTAASTASRPRGSATSARPCRSARRRRRSARAAPRPPRPPRATCRPALDVARLERRPRALQRAVDGGDARLEQLRDLARLPAQHLAEDQDRALARRQVLQRGDEREPDRLARDGLLGGVRDRLDPRHLGQDVAGSPRSARAPGRGPSAWRGARARSACRGRRSWRSGRATSGAPRGPRSGRTRARRAGTSPGPRPRPRTASASMR